MFLFRNYAIAATEMTVEMGANAQNEVLAGIVMKIPCSLCHRNWVTCEERNEGSTQLHCQVLPRAYGDGQEWIMPVFCRKNSTIPRCFRPGTEVALNFQISEWEIRVEINPASSI
jgi:hypothetical protein